MTGIVLRDYQRSLVDGIRSKFAAGSRAVLAVAPTGAGKTILFSYIARGAVDRGNRVLVLVHRRELMRQASRKLTETGVKHGLIAPGHTPTNDAVQVASVQTLMRRLSNPAYKPPSLLIIDEAHHAVAGQWATVCSAYPNARLLGVTATPERLDGRGLGVEVGGAFDTMVTGPTVAELIEGGFLTPSRVFAPAEAPDLTGVRTRGGDYEAGALASAMVKPQIVGDAVNHYARHAAGQPAILFSPSVAHAEAMADAFKAAGFRAVAASGASDMSVRDAAIAGLGTGAVQVLCSCDLISEGLDVPAVSAVILMRPTKSLGLFLQQVGRGLRPAPGKSHLLILDHAGNTLKHGLPETPREWTLEGRPKKAKKDDVPPARQCPKCFAVHPPAPACTMCGHTYVAVAREIQHVEGELSELSGDRLAALKTRPLREVLRGANTEDQLKEIAKARGYKHGWVRHIMRERQQRSAAA